MQPLEEIRKNVPPESFAHVCVDMQNVFLDPTRWETPWAQQILGRVRRIVAAIPDRTVFARFRPPQRWTDAEGAWKIFYRHWEEMTLSHSEPELFDVPDLLVSLATAPNFVDRSIFNPWQSGELEQYLARWRTRGVIITGCETDVCVLSAALGAVDRGLFVIVPRNAVCGSVNATHDAALSILSERYSTQIAVVDDGVVESLLH